jgi:dihydropteroate synthase
MGIVNATPDSFSDGGRHVGASAIAWGRRLFADGAAIVDVGGESTRPGAFPVSLEEERERAIPVVRELAALGTVSIDTYKAAIADEALASGATIVNDVSGGLLDPELLPVCAKRGATVILGHLRGTPTTMNDHASYRDVVTEVRDELRARIEHALDTGIDKARIFIDPGLGFSKRAEHSLAILAKLDALRILDVAIVVGASRKSFLAAFAGKALSMEEREEATAAAHAIAIERGAEIVRVHDVARQLVAVRLAEALRGQREAQAAATGAQKS